MNPFIYEENLPINPKPKRCVAKRRGEVPAQWVTRRNCSDDIYEVEDEPMGAQHKASATSEKVHQGVARALDRCHPTHCPWRGAAHVTRLSRLLRGYGAPRGLCRLRATYGPLLDREHRSPRPQTTVESVLGSATRHFCGYDLPSRHRSLVCCLLWPARYVAHARGWSPQGRRPWCRIPGHPSRPLHCSRDTRHPLAGKHFFHFACVCVFSP